MLQQEGELWHRRMGHISPSVVHKLKYVTEGVGEMMCNLTIKNCHVCAPSKQTRKSFTKDREGATRPCEIIHSDLMGPIKPVTFTTKYVYIMCVIDDFTRFLQMFLLKSKMGAEVAKGMCEALRFLQALFPGPGQFSTLRCDMGTEYTGKDMTTVLEKYDIICDESEPFCHEHNGTVERLNRTIQERARALLFESGFPTRMWDFAVNAACFIYNRTPHSALDFVTPYEKLYQKVPDLSNIRIFGSRVNVLSENVPKGKKFDSRSKIMYLVGYTKTGYLVYDSSAKKSIRTCNVVIDESKLYKHDYPIRKFETFVVHETTEDPLNASGVEGSSTSDDGVSTIKYDIDLDWDETEEVTVNTCGLTSEEYGGYIQNIHVVDNNLPLTYVDAVCGSEKEKWITAIKAELDAMQTLNVWTIVKRSGDMLVVPVKWIFTIKDNGTYKARLVAVGCRDKEVYKSEDKVSPTPTAATIRWLLVHVVKFQWTIVQIDVKNAFLNADIDRTKYVSVPEGIEVDKKRFVCKLNKALYGLVAAPKC